MSKINCPLLLRVNQWFSTSPMWAMVVTWNF